MYLFREIKKKTKNKPDEKNQKKGKIVRPHKQNYIF